MRHPSLVLSDAVGVPDPTLRLLLTILLAYPVAIGYQSLFYRASDVQQDNNDQYGSKENFIKTIDARNKYILASGVALAIFFNGWQVYHSIVTLVISYALCVIFERKRVLAVATVWLFNAAYLLGGYYVMAAEEYDISWTMTQCILCLRLLGFSMDYMDGQASEQNKSVKAAAAVSSSSSSPPLDQKSNNNNATSKVASSTINDTTTTTTTFVTANVDTATNSKASSKSSVNSRPLSFAANTALTSLPSFIQVAAYCFYPSAFLVGPQFSFSLYQDWLLFYDAFGTPSSCGPAIKSRQQLLYAAKCATWGIFYLIVQQIIGSHYPTSNLLTPAYAALPFIRRLGIFWLTGKFVFTKYLGIWLLTEGATALFGIGYEGQKSDGRHSFAGLANVNPVKYETATSIEDIISSFNINTNYWSKYYVFKRLRWMNSKTASQTGTLAFLAIWHGFHYGYFTTFLMEFLDVMAEGILRKWIALLPPVRSQGMQWIRTMLAWCLCTFTLFYAGVGFDLLSLTSSWMAYRQVYFIGHVALFAILLSTFFLPKAKTPRKKAE